MLVVNRFRGPAHDAEAFRADVQVAFDLLAVKPGYVDGQIGRNLDEPDLWVMVTRWRNVGSYRRALAAYDVKLGAVPLLSRAIDEPSAYELLGEETELNTARPRELD